MATYTVDSHNLVSFLKTKCFLSYIVDSTPTQSPTNVRTRFASSSKLFLAKKVSMGIETHQLVRGFVYCAYIAPLKFELKGPQMVRWKLFVKLLIVTYYVSADTWRRSSFGKVLSANRV